MIKHFLIYCSVWKKMSVLGPSGRLLSGLQMALFPSGFSPLASIEGAPLAGIHISAHTPSDPFTYVFRHMLALIPFMHTFTLPLNLFTMPFHFHYHIQTTQLTTPSPYTLHRTQNLARPGKSTASATHLKSNRSPHPESFI